MNSYNTGYYETTAPVSNSYWIVIVFFVGLILLTFLFIYWYKKMKFKERMERSLEMVSFLISLPKEAQQYSEEEERRMDFRQVISVAEQMFSSYAGLAIQGFKIKDAEHITYEIISYKKVIYFMVSCPKKILSLVEKQIHAYYPAAQIEPVDVPNIFENESGTFAVTSLKLMKSFIYPIETYTKLESDSLNNVTNALSKLGDDTGAIQILVRPMNQKWRRKVEMSIKKIQEGKTVLEYGGWRKIFKFIDFWKTKNPDKADDMSQITPLKQKLIEDMTMKANKTGFQTIIRLVATGENKEVAETNLANLSAGFNQFYSPNINGLKPSKKNSESDLIKAFIFKEFAYSPKMILNIEELSTIFHFPNRNIGTPGIKWLISRLLPPPPNLPQEGVIIGKSIYRGDEYFVRMKEDDRRRHLFMIGKTGVGKTTFLQNMVIQDIQNGKGICFLDPNGDAYEYILKRVPKERAEDIILFDPSDTERPIGLNLLDWKTPEQKDFLVQESILMFYKLFDPNHTGMVGPQFEHWMRNAALTVMSDPAGGTLIDLPRLFTDDAFRAKEIGYVTDPVVKAFWDQQMAKTADFHKSEMYNYFISKFGRFMTNDMMRNIIGQPKSSIDFREAMDSGKIILVNLSKGKIGDVNAGLLGMILVSKIQAAAFSRADSAEEGRKDFYLYVDEFQNFTTDTFATILSEARKYRLNLIITNQYIAQLTDQIRDAVIGNAGTLVLYRIGATDAEFMQHEFPGLTVEDFANLDFAKTYCKLLIDGAPTKPFSMLGIKNDTPANDQLGEAIRNLARTKYCHAKEEVEAAFQTRMQDVPRPEIPAGLPPLRETS
ncbi:MAG: ATP-binding protein [Patescibacteria group bacterium]|jgi:hypothetical protein